jgi:uncharacterized protein
MLTEMKALLVFIRYPEAGKVKTRLARGVGEQKAAGIYEKLLRRTLGIVSDFQFRNPDVRVVLYHTPEDPPHKVKAKFKGCWEFCSQEGRHLGMRMENAVRSAFCAGAGRVVLIGSDIADIQVADLEEAFEKTQPGTAVLGPASDGGFYLIGLREPSDSPFRFEQWGTGDIFSRTIRDLRDSGFQTSLVSERKDIDRPEDLRMLDGNFIFNSALSVVIPTLSGPGKISPLLDYLTDLLWPGDEIIAVQGRAQDRVTVHPHSGSIIRVESPKGRGIQQEAGAKVAGGDLFLFLHDDTIPPSNFAYQVRKECEDGKVALGCFRLEFSPSNRLLDLIARWADWRAAALRLPYGDQCLFCRRDIFEKAGGFRKKYLMEDTDLVKRCRKLGRLVVVPSKVITSPERYTRKGILTASVENHMLMLLNRLGVEEQTLYSIYYGEKRDNAPK